LAVDTDSTQPESPAAAAPQPDAADAGAATGRIYYIANANGELRQSEIISGLVQADNYQPATGDVDLTVRPYAIVMTQDCDLLTDHNQQNADILNGVLLYEAQPYAESRAANEKSDKRLSGAEWRRIRENNSERYHFLEGVPPECDLLGQGIPPLIIDFRRHFTLRRSDILRQCTNGTAQGACRRCFLEIPYREHLQTRAAFYFQRVGLPVPHNTDID
jgi:hypothetical protein